MNVLVWFKRDLRMHDHPALTLAAASGRVLPVYIAEPDTWARPETSARQWDFTAECLADLREALATLGAPLVIRVGDAVAVLDRLCLTHAITRIISHEEAANHWTLARDRRVRAWARAAGVEWIEVPQSGDAQHLPDQGGCARPHDAFGHAPQVTLDALMPVSGVAPGGIPAARALRLAPDPCPHRQAGGRTHGLLALESFLAQRGAPYRAAMASPLTGERACSRLSPHLALGSLSLREVVQACALRQAERPGGDWSASLRAFQNRLSLRGGFMQGLGGLSTGDPHNAQRAMTPPCETDAVWLAAWAAGQTGLPFVDACMRYLAATGWLNFQARATMISFAAHYLRLDWRAIGTVLARLLTDYEPAIHWPQVQMQSGAATGPPPRPCNPVKQGQTQDPSGVFTRRWVPELAKVPDAFLHEPWKWHGAAGLLWHHYPEPLVDPATSARAIRALRREAGFPACAVSPVNCTTKVGPTAGAGLSTRALAPRRPAAIDQLSLDL